jgi:hypothetical protein
MTSNPAWDLNGHAGSRGQEADPTATAIAVPLPSMPGGESDLALNGNESYRRRIL